MKVRKHDLKEMLKFNPKVLEFHFSDSDLNLTLDGQFTQRLIVHCYEYFDRKLIDIASKADTNQIHSQEKSIELIQKVIDKTISLNEQFSGKAAVIVHPGGYSVNELDQPEIQRMKDCLADAVNQLDLKNTNFLLENMPPHAWFFGGRWNCNVFLNASEIVDYCKETGLKVCYDLCHSQLYCNKNNMSLVSEFEKLASYVDHFHLSDAGGIDDEGLQLGEGNIAFDKVIPQLNVFKEKSFAIEVWQGHEQGGKGFKNFLEKIIQKGLIVN